MRKSFPHYLQLDEMDCGSTSLRMIAKYYGKEYSAEMLRQHCHITRNGVSMLGISEAAEYLGFRTLGVRITMEQLAHDASLPCILHWNQNHFVVCYKVKKYRSGRYRFYIADPASQKLCYTEEEFLHCWLSTKVHGQDCGMALLMIPGVNFGKRKEECESHKRNIKFFFKYLKPYQRQVGLLLLGMLLGSLLQLVFPFLTQALVDRGVNGKNLGFVTLILIAQLVLFIAQLSVNFIRGWILLHVNTRIDIALISDFLVKLMKMPLHFFDTKKIGDLMQRIEDHSRIKSFLMGNSLGFIFSLANFVVFSVVLGYYSLLVLGVFLLGNTLYILWVTFFMKYRRELDYKRFSQSATERNKMIQLIQGMQDIKLNNCERQKRWEWERVQMRLFRISVKGLTIGQLQQSGSVFFSQSTNILITFIAARNVIHGDMTLGMMMSLTYIIGQLSAPINDFISFIQSVQDAKISLERLNEIHSQPDEDTDLDDKVSELPEDRTIRVEHVTFSYDGAERNYALNDVSLEIPERKVTAIVGESGCGKTTLIKLLQGFYQPNHGSIKVGNLPLTSINPHFWRSVTGSVMQESFIFSDTFAHNIALDSDSLDETRLYQAAKMANVDGFIRTLPLGYHTKIGMEGNGVSQGQRQRLLIARAIYKNPEYIFFDEATNALDTTNESEIMHHLYEFYHGRTVVVAAHRLSTVKNADQIVVMTAIVGESGCGKTTLIKLLQGFYQPNHGSIKVGNLPLTSINPHFWRSVTGSVMQESFIFSDTFAHNIALDSDSLDETRLYQAAKMANVDGFIRTLPLGYHTKIGMEGNGVSQGQRQRLLIARAIYKNPEYIFFDEATNALDTTNESEIMHHLYEFYHGRTVVVAAHRLSTVKNADQIVVIDQGKVVEVGNHESLTAKRGAYYNLVKNQLELGN
jgi:ATP-binding cassette, subfamily B, bacterial